MRQHYPRTSQPYPNHEKTHQHYRSFSLPSPALLALAPTSRAEEGGSAHYLPGATASFIDAFPGYPGGVAVLNYFTYYGGSVAGSGRTLPLGGYHWRLNATCLCRHSSPWAFLDAAGTSLGGYAWGSAIRGALRWMEARPGPAHRSAGRPGPGNARDTANGIGRYDALPVHAGLDQPPARFEAGYPPRRLCAYGRLRGGPACERGQRTTGRSSRASWQAG